jgi:hypothetical protein
MWPRRVWVLSAVVALALVLSACANSGFHYVKSSSDHTYFKVPESWKLYDNEALLKVAKADLTAEQLKQARQNQWSAIFDGHPHPALSHVTNRAPTHPVGRALVQSLSAESADGVSLMQLRNIFYDVDTRVSKDTASVVSYTPVERDGGFHGSHLVIKLTTSKGDTILNQIALVDQATSKVYAIAVKCSTACYEKNKTKIEQVIDSWTVKAS